MRIYRADAESAKAWFHGAVATALCLLVIHLPRPCCAAGSRASSSSTQQRTKLVVVLYPEAYNGSPGSTLVDQGIRSAFSHGSREQIEVHNEYLDVSRFANAAYQQDLADFLRRKYADRKVDLVIAGLSSALDFAIRYRDRIFANVPIVFVAVDEQEVKKRDLAPDIIGAPIQMDLADSLDVALQLHPQTEQVFVIVGKSKFDAYWEAEARKVFHAHKDRVRISYLSGLPMSDLLARVRRLPDRSIAYYLHVFEDGDGLVQTPAEVLGQLSSAANVPFYSHVDSYIGRGIVGGRVFSFETAGRRAAQIGLRIFGGESPRQIGIQPTIQNAFVFDGRQLNRWDISEASLPEASEIRFQSPGLWQLYKWRIAAVIAFCILQTLLIVRLVAQRLRLARAKRESNDSRRELQALTGKLFGAQEAERRRIASELHDDFGQSLALLSVEIDLLRRAPAEPNAQTESLIDAMSAQVKQLSSSIHDLSHQLHPMKLEQLGLVAALQSLCNELNRSSALRVEFSEQDVSESIPHAVSVCLYRIVQESLRNVIKHSGASHAAVELCRVNGEICLRVQDDGKGFDLNSSTGQGGLGLVSMRERLRAVEGNIAVTAEPSQGTQVVVRVPLSNGNGNHNNNGLDAHETVAIASG
jgi:signal transduction histidine kinase